MMHMQYRVKLSDHDFVVAKSHKLIPSVIAAMKVKENCVGEQVRFILQAKNLAHIH